MSVESKASMREAWTRWQGQVLNGTFPLHRYLGGSDHSGVFLTEHAARQLPEVAVKLVPAIPTLAESQLSQWNTAATLTHPHLVRIFESGRCRLGGLPYLYSVMEYSDQNLAQLLLNRALTADEARDMLLPIVNALEFLHDRGLVHGGLKPANILVVGDQLKLASDTICGVGDVTASINMASVYDPPEARDGSRSTASDIWALGVTLYEALTRDPPTGIGEPGVSLVLPHGFPGAFRELAVRCLSRKPADRPKVREIEAFVRGEPLAPAAPAQLAATAEPISLEWTQKPAARGPAAATPASAPTPAPAVAAPVSPAAAPKPTAPNSRTAAPSPAAPDSAAHKSAAPTRPARPAMAPASAVPQPSVAKPAKPSSSGPATSRPSMPPDWLSYTPLIVGAVAVVGLVWFGVHELRSRRNTPPPAAQAPALPPSPPAVDTGAAPKDTVPPARPATSPPASTAPRSPANKTPTRAPATAKHVPSTAPSVTVHEELPDVPRSARMTIHGHVRVSVRLMVNKDGTVFASLVDNRGPSRYFERLAIDSAKKWTFTAVDGPERRLELVRFDFTREGVTARAVEVH